MSVWLRVGLLVVAVVLAALVYTSRPPRDPWDRY